MLLLLLRMFDSCSRYLHTKDNTRTRTLTPNPGGNRTAKENAASSERSCYDKHIFEDPSPCRSCAVGGGVLFSLAVFCTYLKK